MKSIADRTGLTWAALLLALPTAYFFGSAFLKYSLGIDGPFDAVNPFLESMGINKRFGWNINLLILFGPFVAFLLTSLQFVQLRFALSPDSLQFGLAIRKKWFAVGVCVLSAALLVVLTYYLLGENCRCK
jgi:hypothetical protein